MKNPSAEHALNIIDDLVSKTLNMQTAFAKTIEKLLQEAIRLRESVDDVTQPLTNEQTTQVLLNVSYIIRELGTVERGLGPIVSKAPHPKMTYEIETDAVRQ